MRMLNSTEINQVSGGYNQSIRPSNWMFSAGFGATMGSFAYVITAFSAHPAGFSAITMGAGVAVAIHATHDILRQAGL